MIEDFENRYPKKKGSATPESMRDLYSHAYNPRRNEGFFLRRKLSLSKARPKNIYSHEDGTLLGDYWADLLVEDAIVIELKTAKSLAVEHQAQILGYLKSAKLEHGLLINFGSPRFEIRKFVWTEEKAGDNRRARKRQNVIG
ncbi:MAG: GxxExxY protein [Deltaproteobacteria bacterium]|nr:GxxExxY protein [Deltaproteobacteria bacterium]